MLSSIPHSGTYFTIRLFTDFGFREAGLFEKCYPQTIYHGHMVKRGQIERALELSERMPLVIPMRHPFRVEESWKRRGRSVDEMLACYRTFLAEFWLLRPYILPIDSERRDAALSKLREGLGLELRTDWPVVNGVKGAHAIGLDELEPSERVIELVEEMRPILVEYY